MKLLTIFGTRPEAVKLAPVLIALRREPGIVSKVCVTGQHRSLLQCACFFKFGRFRLKSHEARSGASLLHLARDCPDRRVLAEVAPTGHRSVQHTVPLRLGWAALQSRITVAYSRSWASDLLVNGRLRGKQNRSAIALTDDLHLAATPAARANSSRSCCAAMVYVPGNTASARSFDRHIQRRETHEAVRSAMK